MTSEATPAVPTSDADAMLREIETIVESTTAKNWREKKPSLLALVSAAT